MVLGKGVKISGRQQTSETAEKENLEPAVRVIWDKSSITPKRAQSEFIKSIEGRGGREDGRGGCAGQSYGGVGGSDGKPRSVRNLSRNFWSTQYDPKRNPKEDPKDLFSKLVKY